MSFLFAIIYLIILPIVIATVLAAVLPTLLPQASYRNRTLIAAGLAGFLPMAIPLAAIIVGWGAGHGYSPFIPFLALLFMGLIIMIVIGLPTAIVARRGKEPDR